MDGPAPPSSRASPWALPVAALLLVLVSLLFWKLRIFDTAVVDSVTIPNIDLFVAQAPVTEYAFAELRAGRLPLWNPYQLCGSPFLALTYVGIFYPANWIYLWLDVPTGIEVSFLLHMLFGCLGMWELARRLRLGSLAGVAAGLTFMWSGFAIHWANQPQLFAGLAWAPWTVCATDAALRGRPSGTLALAVALACQVFNGAMEILLHTLYVAGSYAALQLGLRARRDGARAALGPALGTLGGVVLGLGLSAVQLLPTLELVAQSARGPGELGFEEVVLKGRLAPSRFFREAAAARGLASTGVLGLVAFALAIGLRGKRAIAGLWVALAGVAVWLAFGGQLFRLYTELPIGTLFRRSYKFLDIYAFAQALLVALAVTRLRTWSAIERPRLWRKPSWWLALGLSSALCAVQLSLDRPSAWLATLVALLLAYGASRTARLRQRLVVALVAVHAASLFVGVENRYIRPIHRPDHAADHAERSRLDLASPREDHERLYLSPSLWFMKQGTAQRIPVVADYEPLTLERYAAFFETASGWRAEDRPFNGRYSLSSATRWSMMDLTGTRYYVTSPWDLKLLGHFRAAGPEGGFVPRDEEARRVFERSSALPRAWVVGGWRALSSREEVLAGLAAPDFDARAEVLLESPASRPSGPPGVAGSARIISFAAEEVVVDVEAARAGLLVLSDLHYPGWEAFVDGREAAILRADFLFRAVPVEAGASEVRFVYRPGSFRLGAALTAVAALVGVVSLRRRRR